MSQVEEFLAAQELFRCTRMNSNLTKKQCESNKKSGRYFSCELCKGLEEKVDMGKTSCCSVAGCEKYVSRDGLCWLHFKDRHGMTPDQAKKSQVKVERVKQVERKAPAPAPAPAPVEVEVKVEEKPVVPQEAEPVAACCLTVPAPPAGSTYIADMLDVVLTGALQEHKLRWIGELADMSPAKALCRAAQIIERLEGVGHAE
jgi:hypothetical protein